MTNMYPKLNLRSKNEIAKRISGRKSHAQSLNLINDCLENKNRYWHDNKKRSEPDKEKYVRSCKGTKLGALLTLIDQRVFKPNDKKLPLQIFGSVGGKDIKSAGLYLLGNNRYRTILKLDMSRFFEHIKTYDVERTLEKKMGCTGKAARVISALVCVPEGPKKNPTSNTETLARGFATSTRLAVWCNLGIFVKIINLVNKELKGHDPRIAFYIDDILITASRVEPRAMGELFYKIENLIERESERRLELNQKKTRIIDYQNKEYNLDGSFKKYSSFEALGLKMGRNKLSAGAKNLRKLQKIRNQQKQGGLSNKERLSKAGIMKFRAYISKTPRDNPVVL